VCRSRDHWIVLNATRDRYLCITHRDLSQVGDRLHGWRDHSESGAPLASLDTEAEATIAALMASKVITTDQAQGKPFVEIQYDVRDSSIAPPANQSPRLRPAAVIRIALACAKADLQLRTRAFSRLVDRIKERRDRRRPAQPYDQSSISSLVHAFNVFRSFYPRPYLCLFDSLALLEFLSSYRIYPQLVIGVVPDPFEAHCWLQEGTVVLNDDLERISKYTSIAGF
jgi:hypothetical protein